MHAVLEGVTRWLLRTWIDSHNHNQPYYIGRCVKKLDKLLLQQQPPHELSRSPRSLEAHLKYLKASELRSWLLFYSLPLLLDILPSLYLHHFALLVCAVHILLQDSFTKQQIDAADEMIMELLPDLYGLRFT